METFICLCLATDTRYFVNILKQPHLHTRQGYARINSEKNSDSFSRSPDSYLPHVNVMFSPPDATPTKNWNHKLHRFNSEFKQCCSLQINEPAQFNGTIKGDPNILLFSRLIKLYYQESVLPNRIQNVL